jgi:hypothetical protein
MSGRSLRRLAAWLGILAIVFAQVAVAAYACPALGAALAGPDQHVPCPDMDPAQPNLCDRHCHGGDEQAGGALALTPSFVVSFVIARVPPGDAADLPAFLPAPAPPPSPPLAVRHRFRI